MPSRYEISAVITGENRASAAFNEAQTDARQLSATLDALDNKRVEIPVSVRDSASADLKDIERAAVRVDMLSPEVTVKASTSDASRAFAKITSEAAAIGKLRPTVDVDVDTGAATANLARFQAQTVATTAATESLAGALGGGIRAAAGTVRGGGLLGSLALLGPAVVAGTAAVGPAAAGLTTAGVAATSAAGGLGLLAGAAFPLVKAFKDQEEAAKKHKTALQGVKSASDSLEDAQLSLRQAQQRAARVAKESGKNSSEYKTALQSVKKAQLEVRQAEDKLTAARKEANRTTVKSVGYLDDLKGSFKDFKQFYFSAFEPATKQTAQFGSELLDISRKAMPALGREAKQTIGATRREFDLLSKELGGREKSSLNGILDSMSDTFSSLVRSSGRFGGGLANVFKEGLPFAEDLAGWINRMSKDFLTFTRQKPDSVRAYFASAVPVAKEVADLTGDILGFVINFGKRHGDELADALDLVGDTLDDLFGGKEQKKREREAGQEGKAVGRSYGSHMTDEMVQAQEKAAKREGPGIGERWGLAIGRGAGVAAGKALKALDFEAQGHGLGKGLAKGLADGFGDEMRDVNWMRLVVKSNPFFGQDSMTKLGKDVAGGFVDGMKDEWKKAPGILRGPANQMSEILVSPFWFAYKRVVGNSILPDLVRDSKKEFEKLADNADSIMGRAAKSIKNHLQQGAEWGWEALKDLADKGSGSQKDLEKVSTAEMKKTAGWIGHHLEAGKRDGTKALGTLRDEGSKSQKKLQENSSSSMEKTKKDSNTFLSNMKEVGLDIVGTFKEKGSDVMGKIPDKWLPPMKKTSGDTQGYLNHLLFGMGEVIEKAKLGLTPPDTFKPKTDPAWLTAPGHSPAAEAASGLSAAEVRQLISGAVRGSGEPEFVTGPTVLSGEALSPGNREYTFITEEPAYEERNRSLFFELGARKGWLDASRQAAFSHAPPAKLEMFGKGGKWEDDLSNYPQMSPWNNFVGQVAALVKKRIGSDPSTYEGHSPTMERAIDFMQKAFAREPGDTIADFLYGNAAAIGLDYEIWRQRIRHPGGGWSGMEDRGSPTQNHFDHVHGSFLSSPGSGKVSSNATYKGGANGGGEGLDIEPFIKKYIAEVPDFGKHLPASEAEEIASSARSAIVQELRKAAGTVGGGRSGRSGPAPPGKVGEWVAAGLALADQPADWGRDMTHLAMIESGGDPRARNPTAVGGEHATGLFQTLPSTFDAYHEAGHQDIYDPEDNTGAAANYIDDRYGSPAKIPNLYNPSAYQGYTMGGIAFKPHWAKVAEDGTPEVMMPLNTQAGVEMVRFLKTLPLRGDDDSVGHGSVEGRLRRLEEKLEEQTERIERALAGRLRVGVEDIDDGPREAIVDAAVGAQESPAGRKAQERNRTRDLDRIVRKGS